ncbi:CapA family protein [Legionella sp. MW5194]|uniref:CapA family protein n=1 Tax=Legionella sp. MW5194 TaxID=2662448 RepID=UPI00193CA200|nr:CapA family protein [Legionella sp. MW5194]QRN04083.1 CapA family protein [Legionella sp. MW5194]
MPPILPVVTGLLLCTLTWADTVHIIAVGDVLLHAPLQKKGLAQGFDSLWTATIPQLKKADITYGNLEGPTAGMIDMYGKETKDERRAYTSFPMFNYSRDLVKALKLSGFDILSTANNHTLDRLSLGIDRTISTLNEHHMAYTGTRSRNSKEAWYTVTVKNTLSIAWIACSQDTNGITDRYRQVLLCYRDKPQVLELIAELAKTHDAVIVTPHWGVEYQTRPNNAQKTLAREFANAGALAILGSHPHCVQPFDWVSTAEGKKVFIAYSLGNFISNQGSLKNRASGLLSLHLRKEAGVTAIDKVAYQPTYMENRSAQMSLSLVTSARHPAYQWLKQVVGADYLVLPKKKGSIKPGKKGQTALLIKN